MKRVTKGIVLIEALVALAILFLVSVVTIATVRYLNLQKNRLDRVQQKYIIIENIVSYIMALKSPCQSQNFRFYDELFNMRCSLVEERRVKDSEGRYIGRVLLYRIDVELKRYKNLDFFLYKTTFVQR